MMNGFNWYKMSFCFQRLLSHNPVGDVSLFAGSLPGSWARSGGKRWKSCHWDFYVVSLDFLLDFYDELVDFYGELVVGGHFCKVVGN